MNILLVGISAKFIHSCLAVHLLQQYALEQYGIVCQTAEYTINQQEDLILSEIYKQHPDFIGFSCYIWNFEQIKSLLPNLKKVLPHTRILLGGPEVSFDEKEILQSTPADFVLSGEGEEAFSLLCRALLEKTSLSDVPSLTYWEKNEIRKNPVGAALSLEKLPFVYQNFDDYQNKIIYYEAQRGCPFHCQYCLSSLDHGVRFQPIDKVKKELSVFLQQRVRQVKFVDRTFNANAKFAVSIWKYLHENDNGITNFHFEIAADLLTDEMINFLKVVRPGLFQFEIGVQSTNEQTLSAIERISSFERICAVVRKLQAPQNIHLHLDLIAGLPFEDFESFGHSFDDVYALSPDQFQLGFLKLLKGSGLRENQQKYGIVCRDTAPYEVLFTDALPFNQMLHLKMIEELTELYYNSNRFRKSLQYLVSLAESPFDFFRRFSLFYEKRGDHLRPHAKLEQYDILYQFGSNWPHCDKKHLRWLMKFDLYSHENAKKLPSWLTEDITAPKRTAIYRFLEDPASVFAYLPEYVGCDEKQIYKMAHIECFPFDPLTKEDGETAILFNYRNTDILGNAKISKISLPSLQKI